MFASGFTAAWSGHAVNIRMKMLYRGSKALVGITYQHNFMARSSLS